MQVKLDLFHLPHDEGGQSEVLFLLPYHWTGKSHQIEIMEIPWQDVGSINNLSHFLFLKKVFIEFATILLLFYVLGFFFFSGHEACGILAPWPETESEPFALEGKILTTESVKSPRSHFLVNPFMADEVEWRGMQRRKETEWLGWRSS